MLSIWGFLLKTVFKSTVKTLFSIFLILNILLFTDRMISAAYNTLMLWFNTVIPSLFPFMVISSWLDFNVHTHKTIADKITLKLFGVPSTLIPVFIIGTISGYPTGARLISELYTNKRISKDTAEHLLAFCNNAGTVFIVSAVASSMLNDRFAGVFFVTITAFSAMITGIVYNLIFPAVDYSYYSTSASLVNQASTSIGEAIMSAVKAILTVGGCMVFFSVITEAVTGLIPDISSLHYGIVSGIFEFTRGISLIAVVNCNKQFSYAIIAGLLSWGGLSVHLQTAAVISSDKINILKYLICKAFSSFVSFLTAINAYNFFYTKTSSIAVFNEIKSYPSPIAISVVLSALILVQNYLQHKKGSI